MASLVGIISWLASNWRWVLRGLAVVASFYAGYLLKSMLVEASEARQLRRDLVALEEVTERLDATRVTVGLSVDSEQSRLTVLTKTLIKKVPVYVADDRRCDFSAEFVRLRNLAAQGRMPDTTDKSP